MHSADYLVSALQQLLLALTFFIIPIIAFKYGDKAQEIAEKEVADQGIATDGHLLIKNGFKLSESKVELLLPYAICIILLIIGTLNLAGNELGRILTWIIEPILLIVVGLVTAAQVFPGVFLRGSFKKAKDKQLQSVNLDKLLNVVRKAFPAILWPLQVARFALVTFGSIVVMMMLLT